VRSEWWLISQGCLRNGVSNFGKKKEWLIVMWGRIKCQCISIGRENVYIGSQDSISHRIIPTVQISSFFAHLANNLFRFLW